ncbi:hypothetical protein ACFPA1_20215 [Neobacillus sp. GCM10023253]|uniref:hypothetical protein n=1 Tax=Neobacillus sp. GCM10023253 TaxID=3252644 RepID=UPI003606352D
MGKKMMIFGIVILLLSAVTVYWFYYSKPDRFLTNQQLVEEINHVFPEVAADTIQDIIHVDERHKVIPFVTKDNRYGLSYWAWKNHQWKAVYIDNAGEPKVWRVNQKNPSTYTIVWNIHPDDAVSYMKFYLKKDRNYLIRDGIETYYPGILLEKTVPLDGKSYGVLRMPAEWSSVIDSFDELNKAKQLNFFQDVFPARDLFFGWTPYKSSGEEAAIKATANGNSFHSGEELIDFIMYVNESDLKSE